MDTARNVLLDVLMLAVCLCVAAPAGAKLIQHLDATVAGSVVTDAAGVVTQWTDLSGAGNHATPGVGEVIYPSTIAFPGGPAGLDFGETRNSLVLLPSAATGWLNPNAGAGGGFAVLVVFRANAVEGTVWNDVIGNSSAVANGFMMRHHGADGRIQAALDGTINTGAGPVEAGDTIIYAFNYDAATGAYDFWVSKNDSSVTGTRAAGDFTRDDLTLGTTSNGGRFFRGLVGEVLIFDSALSLAEFNQIKEDLIYKWITPSEEKSAFSAPSPGDGSMDLPLNGNTLSWKRRADSTAQGDLYFGIHFDDVNTATLQNDPAGVYVGRQSQTSFALAPLEYSQTYYWRVDEVNSAPESTVSPGEVWSFATEPFSIPISNITATASSTFGVSGPENTINGSGLTGDLHGVSAPDMWISMAIPASIEWTFDQTYKLHEMWVWNSNQSIEPFIGFGAQDVVIEHSLDGENWTVLEGASKLAQAPGAPGYAHNNTIDFGGAAAQHVRMGINTVHGFAPQASLSEVRFLYIPTLATGPNPVSGATEVSADVTLSWDRDGREAGRHDIYLGFDPNTLSLAGSVTESSFDTLEADLRLGQTYYWQVVEVNDAMDPMEWAGTVWSFTTVGTIAIDDMEGYRDEEFLEIWATWIDGFDDPINNGAIVGAVPSLGDFAPETTIVYGGGQSLPIHFDNSGAPRSEATRTFDAAMDWTRHGVQSLVLFFGGSPATTGGQLYLKINDTKVSYHGASSDLMNLGWNKWTIPLSSVSASTLSRVTSLTIGIEGDGSGVLYVDEIQLTTDARLVVTPTQPTDEALVAHYAFDGDVSDSTGQSPGTLFGDRTLFVPGVNGQALRLDGVNAYVAIDGLFYDSTGFSEVSVTAWIRTEVETDQIIASFDRSDYWRLEINLSGAGPGQVGWDVMTDAGQLDSGSSSRVDDGEWHHVAGVFDNGTSTIFIDGYHEAPVTRGSTLGTGNLRYGFVGVGSEAVAFDGAKNGNPNYFVGDVDDVRIYHRALSAAEVAGMAGRTDPFEQP